MSDETIWKPFVLGAGYFENTPAFFAETPIYAGLVGECVHYELHRRCGTPHPTNETFIPCMLDFGHRGDHWSWTGCSGSQFAWNAGGETHYDNRMVLS